MKVEQKLPENPYKKAEDLLREIASDFKTKEAANRRFKEDINPQTRAQPNNHNLSFRKPPFGFKSLKPPKIEDTRV